MNINLPKIILAIFLILILLNLSLAQNNIENSERNDTIDFYSQSTIICHSNNLTNNILGECLTFSIYGLNNSDKNFDSGYIYDEEQNIYWLNQGISLHFIFHNENYDFGFRNIIYDEFVDFRNKISDNFIQVRYSNGTILNETYYYANGKLVAKKDNSGN